MITARQLYHSWRHYWRKSLHYASLYEMGEDRAFISQVYAQMDAETGRWPDE